MEGIEEDQLFSLLSLMIAVFRDHLGQYVAVDPRRMPDRTFVKFFLSFCKVVSPFDKTEVLDFFAKTKVANDSSEAFYLYDGRFLKNLVIMGPALIDQTSKSLTEIYAKGLSGHIAARAWS
jgi:hypothetical protein